MKNGFYFNSKPLFVLKIFKFLSWLVGQEKTAWLEFMKSQPGWLLITIHILPNISQSKGNQTIKFDKSIEYNKRNIFLQKSCRKWDRETSSRHLFVF